MSSEAAESSSMVEFLAWLEINKLRLITVAAILGVVGGAIAIYRWHQAQVELQANGALLRVQTGEDRPEGTQKPTAAAFLKVAGDFPSTSAGARAQLLGAGLLFEEGKYAEARGQFQQFLQQRGDNAFAGSAAYGVAACLDAEGKTNEAITAYQNVVARYGTSAAASLARMAEAGLHESRKEFSQALRLYAELAGPAAQSAWSADAAKRRADLLRLHPELAPTNAAPVAASPLPTALNVGASNTSRAPATNR
jgi:predicted negative regulator of RcsB-dependent stress response